MLHDWLLHKRHYRFWHLRREKIIGRDVKFVEINFINSKTLDDYLEITDIKYIKDSASEKTLVRGGEIQDKGSSESDEDAEIIAKNSTIQDVPDQHSRCST